MGRERVLVTEVVVAGSDTESPVLRGVYRPSPRVVPRQQIMGRVVSRPGLARWAGAAHRLEILVEECIAEVIAHLRRLGDESVNGRVASLGVCESLGPVHRLNQTSVRVRGVGVAPLLRVSGIENKERQK